MLQNNKVAFLICPLDAREVPVSMTRELIYRETIQLIAAPDAFTDDTFLDRSRRLWWIYKNWLPCLSSASRKPTP